jgi:hypothetical protein
MQLIGDVLEDSTHAIQRDKNRNHHHTNNPKIGAIIHVKV